MSDATLAANGGTPVRAGPMPPRGVFGEEEKQVVVAMFDEARRG